MTVINDNDNDIDIEKRGKMDADATANAVPFDNSAHRTVASTITPSVASGALSKSKSILSIDASVLQAILDGEPVVDPNERQAYLCCRCCCDVLRACIIVNILYLLNTVTNTVIALLNTFLSGSDLMNSMDLNLSEFDDLSDDQRDANKDELDRLKTYVTVNIAMIVVGTLSAVIGIIGAAKFNKYMVLSTAICYCILVIGNLYSLNFAYAFLRGFFAYPHFALYVALKSGKITRENYEVEKHCCCGGAKSDD